MIRDVRNLRAQNLAQNRPPCAEFGVLRKIEENLPNGAENAKILLISVNPFTLVSHNNFSGSTKWTTVPATLTDTG